MKKFLTKFFLLEIILIGLVIAFGGGIYVGVVHRTANLPTPELSFLASVTTVPTASATPTPFLVRTPTPVTPTTTSPSNLAEGQAISQVSLRTQAIGPARTEGVTRNVGIGSERQASGLDHASSSIPSEPPEVTVEEITPTATPTLVVITSTPTPENLLTVAAVAPTVTYQATTVGTATPLPANWATPWLVTCTPTPESMATMAFQQIESTAAVVAYGTPTPTPRNLVIATPIPTETATPIFILLEDELPPVTPTATPLPALLEPIPPIPSSLMGKIAFKSDRTGREEIYVINPDGSDLALLTGRWPYHLAKLADSFSADGRFRVFTKDMIRYKNIESPITDETIGAARDDVAALYWYDSFYKVEQLLTNFGAGLAYDGAWSPTAEQIAFVSNDSGNDEIWVVNRDGSGLQQLTRDESHWWDKHPSWSPNGQQIVFWSNRSGHRQIWVMNKDGSNLYSLSRTGFNDWDPVWIKYPGLPANALTDHIPYGGPYNPFGARRICRDFATQAEAQAFYLAAGGPFRDPHRLDGNNDGLACN